MVFVGHSIQTFQRHTALNFKTPEYRNLFISTLVRNLLPYIKRQIQNGAAGCAGQSLSVITDGAF